jgi:hypothetical protein
MDEFDLKIAALLSTLAALVNRAGRVEATTAEAVKVAKVPVGLLYEARKLCAEWADTEYTTDALRQAKNRILEG